MQQLRILRNLNGIRFQKNQSVRLFLKVVLEVGVIGVVGVVGVLMGGGWVRLIG